MKLQEAISRCMRLDTWKLRDEAAALAAGVDPRDFTDWTTVLDTRLQRVNELFDMFERSVQAETLAVLNPKADAKDWRVRPETLLGYLAAQHADKRVELPPELVKALPKTPTVVPDARRKVLASTYSTPMLEALFAALAEFWIDYPQGDAARRLSKVIQPWLKARYPKLTPTQVRQIDQLIRHPDERGGGRLSSSSKKVSK